MSGLIEDYAIIGDMQSAALVGRDGSIDWLCLPRFDSPACFAAFLGTERNGQWRIAPAGVGPGTDAGPGTGAGPRAAPEAVDAYLAHLMNTPQAFSHVPLIQAALNLDQHAGAHCRRSARNEPAVSGFGEP